MTIAPAAAAPPAPEAAAAGLAPLLLPQDLRLTPEQFALVCEANPEAVLELAADGHVITMTPTGGETGARNTLLCTRLQIWALERGGWKVFDSCTGFRLADGSVLSPDAAAVRLERWQALSPEQRRTFPPLCPELVIELASARLCACNTAQRKPTQVESTQISTPALEGSAMGMNIKDPVVHAMARELAERRSTSVTDAVRQALRAELERCPNPEQPEAIEARKAAIRAICTRTSSRPEWQGRTSKELQDALYDEDGLPA